jgi:hypothetical protein
MLNGLADQIARSKYPLLLIAMAVFGFHLYDYQDDVRGRPSSLDLGT